MPSNIQWVCINYFFEFIVKPFWLLFYYWGFCIGMNYSYCNWLFFLEYLNKIWFPSFFVLPDIFSSRFLICVARFCTMCELKKLRPCENSSRFSQSYRFFDSCNVQKRATKSDTSGHCLVSKMKIVNWLFKAK